MALLLSLPIAMTYPLAQSPWAPALETTIWCVAALIALAILVKITALARKAGDHLARKIGPTRARLVATAVIVLALANIAARVGTAL